MQLYIGLSLGSNSSTKTYILLTIGANGLTGNLKAILFKILPIDAGSVHANMCVDEISAMIFACLTVLP